MKANTIFTYWNQSEGLIHHKELKHDIKLAIKAALANFSVDDIKEAIANYSTVVSGDEFFWTKRWALGVFLTRKTGQCKDDPKQFWRFLNNNFVKEEYMTQNVTTDSKKLKLFPIAGKTCCKCSLPAVYKNASGDYDHHYCLDHSPERVREVYCC